NGKTTTKEMLASIFRQRGPVLNNEGNLNNHIGVPLTLMKLDRTHRAAVIEMGMSALGEIELLARLARPDVGVITNIGPAHLEFLVTIDRIAQAKGELLEYMKPGGTAVLNADDPYFGALRAKFSGPAISFGIEQQADVSAADISQGKDYIDFTLRARDNSVPVRLRLVGRHNIYNALAAAAAAIAAEVMIDAVKDGLEAFVPRAMRSELKTIKGRVMLEDCYNANPRSMDAALETLVTLRHGRMTIAVLGDMLELGDAAVEAHRAIGRKAAALGVDLVISVGTLSSHIAEGARAGGMSPERVVSVKTNAEAAALLRERSQEGDAILIKGSRGMKMEKILEDF
ncbi:MAG TPA: UDP-N-acetylmuramoyl-tripeptide--D-alanyl-D-alanine ligase, partial [Nitrospiraceae bacterium]|nr:UDP-N-acetylmuramoyl-tripeptide--D-alanyl-D-alanine ligase [Nitrospiraceae bacterium]